MDEKEILIQALKQIWSRFKREDNGGFPRPEVGWAMAMDAKEALEKIGVFK